MADKKNFGDLIRIESGKATIEEWLKHHGLYDDVMQSIKQGARPGVIYRVLRKDYEFDLHYSTVRDLVNQHRVVTPPADEEV